LLPKNYFVEAPEQKSTCGKSIKRRSSIEEWNIELEVGCNAIIQKGLPLKSKDPGSFNLPGSICVLFVDKTLMDLRANINLIPLAMLEKIGELEIKPTKMAL